MKQKDVVVDREYALATGVRSDPRFAARVVVVEAPLAGQVSVRVLEAGLSPTSPARAVAEGDRLSVPVTDLLHPWAERSHHVSAAELERLERDLAAQRARERLLALERPSPDYNVSDEYDDPYGWDPLRSADGARELAAAYETCREDHWTAPSAQDVVTLFGDLPPALRLDVMAATPRTWYPHVEAAADDLRVGSVLARCASLLDRTCRAPRAAAIPRPEEVFLEHDVEFLEELVTTARRDGAELVLPMAPRLPSWATELLSGRLPGAERVVRRFGWLRVATPYTSGSKVHGLGCPSLGHHQDRREVASRAWWQVILEHSSAICGVCGGPNVLHTVEVAHFFAASDVWRTRGREGVEVWQIAAVGRLFAATMGARSALGQFDVSPDAALWDALSPTSPGQEGWLAYESCHPFGQLAQVAPDALEAGRALAVQRLNELVGALPEAARMIPLPAGADRELVRERYAALRKRLSASVPALDRLLFGLPGAI